MVDVDVLEACAGIEAHVVQGGRDLGPPVGIALCARIRYAAHPALADSAVYFKSGSLYGCKPERGYECGKFLGNRINFMNSMVVIESIDRDPPLRYAVVLLSNVLRKNSSDVHQEIGFKIHRLMEGYHPPRPATPPPMDATTSAPSGE